MSDFAEASGQTPAAAPSENGRSLGAYARLQRGWSHWRQADRNFERLYGASLLIDLGLCLHFFTFTLFLVEHHFSEQSIGFITAALTLGTLAGLLPASFFAQRVGLRPIMLAYVIAVPLCFAGRVLFLQMPAQLLLGFISGFALSLWSICFSPTLSKLTTPENRTFGFSLFVATGIASSALSGLIGGYLPKIFLRLHWAGSHVDGLRNVLLLASVIVALAFLAIAGIRLGAAEAKAPGERVLSRFLLSFLFAFAVWSFALNFFTPFANVYLLRHIGLPVSKIGALFSLSQVIQVAAVMLAPVLYRRIGLAPGIATVQLGTGCLLWGLARASGATSAIWIYLFLASLQWTAGPGLSSLLMNRTPERQRSQATAMQNIANLAAQTASTALAGKLFTRFGYSGPLAINAGIAALAAVLMYGLLRQTNASET